MSRADLVISIGTRLTDFATGSQSCFNHPDVRFININVCSHDAHKQGALPVTADAREALRCLYEGAKQAGIQPRPAYVDEIATVRLTWDEKMDREVYTHHEGEAMSQGELIRALNQEAAPATRSSPPREVRPATCSSSGIRPAAEGAI